MNNFQSTQKNQKFSYQKIQKILIIFFLFLLIATMVVAYFLINQNHSSEEGFTVSPLPTSNSQNTLTATDENDDSSYSLETSTYSLETSTNQKDWQQTLNVSPYQKDAVIDFVENRQNLVKNFLPNEWTALIYSAQANNQLGNLNSYDWDRLVFSEVLDFSVEQSSQTNQVIYLELEADVKISNSNKKLEMLYVVWSYELFCQDNQSECQINQSSTKVWLSPFDNEE